MPFQESKYLLDLYTEEEITEADKAFIINAKALKHNTDPELVFYRGTDFEPDDVFQEGFQAYFERPDVQQETVEELLVKYPGERAAILAELMEIAIHRYKIGDYGIETNNAVSFTGRAELAANFPTHEKGRRYVYAIHVPNYFDLHEYELQLDQYTFRSDFEEKAARIVIPQHVFAALECKVTNRTKRGVVYEVTSPEILWNPNASTDPFYNVTKEVIAKRFTRMIEAKRWKISCEVLQVGAKRRGFARADSISISTLPKTRSQTLATQQARNGLFKPVTQQLFGGTRVLARSANTTTHRAHPYLLRYNR